MIRKIIYILIILLISYNYTIVMAGIPTTNEDTSITKEDASMTKENISGLKEDLSKPKLITNVFIETDLRQALRDISAQAGVNIIADNTIQGYVTADLKDVPVEKALEIVLAGGGYTYKWMGDYYLVGLPDIKNTAFNSLSVTEHIKVQNIDASAIVQLLNDFYQPFVKVDPVNNIITVTASKEIVERLKSDIKRLDVPKKQVIIETVVVELSENSGDSLEGGFSWTWPVGETQGTGTGSIGYTYLQGIVYNLDAAQKIWVNLKALAQEGKAKVKASPKISTIDGKEAQIQLGKEEYVILTTGTDTSSVQTLQMIKGGIFLKILPKVIDNSEGGNDIALNISSEVSDVTIGTEKMPTALRRVVSTNVRIKDGQTVVIGGLKQETERETVEKVPILGDIPIIGAFFSSKKTVKDMSDILVFITCKVVNELEAPKE